MSELYYVNKMNKCLRLELVGLLLRCPVEIDVIVASSGLDGDVALEIYKHKT